MKLKYYMRGVGTGILFAVFVFVIIIIPNRDRQKDTTSVINNSGSEGDNDLSAILGNEKLKENSEADDFAVNNSEADSSTENNSQKDDSKTDNSEEDNSVKNDSQKDDSKTDNSKTDNSKTDDSATDSPIYNDLSNNDSKTDNLETNKSDTVDTSDNEDANDLPEINDNENTSEDQSQTINKEGKAEVSEDGETVKFTITYGMNSERFSMQMEKYGVVDSWKELNKYITKNGYEKKIRIGTYTFTKNMSYADICKKIIGKK